MMSDFIGLSEVLHEATMKNKYNNYNHNFTIFSKYLFHNYFWWLLKEAELTSRSIRLSTDPVSS